MSRYCSEGRSLFCRLFRIRGRPDRNRRDQRQHVQHQPRHDAKWREEDERPRLHYGMREVRPEICLDQRRRKVYEIKNQNFAGLEKNVGGTVKATGQVSADGKSITVRKLSPVSAK
jgi:hypothetical protein